MFLKPSLRRAAALTLWIAFLSLTARLLKLSFPEMSAASTVFTTWFQTGKLVPTNPAIQIDSIELSGIFTPLTDRKPNRIVAELLTCSQSPNRITDTIRLSERMLNISLTPPRRATNDASQHFNPTFIPLPPHSPFPYLLLARFVTAGLHQESHICFATICLPANSTSTTSPALSSHTRPCDESDFDVLGSQGGMRCATPPAKLNIPPTPARRCEGAWSAFPDIPGFHDPRMFWSGRGEPLVMVNSGSSYGCVGLWVVDLRAVYPELDDLLSKKGNYVGLRAGEGVAGEAVVPAPMSYPHLTELTKNPRSSREAVEKNWIMFFPRNEESWIQYDLVSHSTQQPDTNTNEDLSLHDTIYNQENFTTSSNDSDMTSEEISNPADTTVHAEAGSDLEETQRGPSDRRRQAINTASEQVFDNFGHAMHQETPATRPLPELRPARTLAKLVGSGYTTVNLTAVDETPCLTPTNLLDNAGRRGHWHQGSNSLRLILCRRYDLACLGDRGEDRLVDDGRVVHISVLHRKFNNEMELPMRYERYFMVWEARSPFRMLGISRHPILFAGEKASPWSEFENGLEQDEEAGRWRGIYFTYTPSLGWAWRRDSVMNSAGRARAEYGTGYLDDEVLVGIGMDDIAQGFAKVQADSLLSCLRLCPDFESGGK